MADLQLQINEKLRPLMEPAPFKFIYGGRGSGKSWGVADLILLANYQRRHRNMCLREIQKSIATSSKQLLIDRARNIGFKAKDNGPFFSDTREKIGTAIGGRFDFFGCRTNTQSIMSAEGYDIAWLEQAERASLDSLNIILPTLRKAGAEFWATWNPLTAETPIDIMARRDPPPGSVVVELNWHDNPWFSDQQRAQMEWMRRRDPAGAAHIWDGEYLQHVEARVFKNWVVDEFETPPDARLYFGADWGFSTDPAALVRFWIDGNTLYIDHEAYYIGCPISLLPALFAGDDPRAIRVNGEWETEPRWRNPRRWAGIPGVLDWPITADSSRPDLIAHMRAAGFNVAPAQKGAGSIEAGVECLQDYDIVVHPRCVHTIEELTLYSYKVEKDPRGQEFDKVLPVIVDRNNHIIDGLRYATEGLRRRGRWRPASSGPEERPRSAGWYPAV